MPQGGVSSGERRRLVTDRDAVPERRLEVLGVEVIDDRVDLLGETPDPVLEAGVGLTLGQLRR